MKKEVSPAVIVGVVIVLVAVIGLLAMKFLGGTKADVTPQTKADLKKMKDDPASTGKAGDK